MHAHCAAADRPADVQPDGAGRADAGEPVGLDRRAGAGRDRQPVRARRSQRQDVSDRAGQQRADVPRPRARDDRLPRLGDVRAAVPGRRPRDRRADRRLGSVQGAAARHRPAARGLRDRRRRRDQGRDRGRGRPRPGRRSHRGGPARDVVARTTHRSTSEETQWPRRSPKCSWTRWSKPGSARSTGSSATRRTRSSTRSAATRPRSSSSTCATRRPAPSRPAPTHRSPGRPTAVLGSSGPGQPPPAQRPL